MLRVEVSHMTCATDPVGGRSSSQAKKRPWPPWRLIATLTELEIYLTHCNKRPCRFLIATKITFLRIAIPLYHFTQSECEGRGQSPSGLCPPDRGARMFYSIIERNAIRGGA